MTGDRTPEIEPNDPTRSGAPLPAGRGARLSRNEIEALCLKAARGAGMSWGLAEEAGFAAGWLSQRGLDGPGALLAQLRTAEARPWRDICPVIEPGAFRALPEGLLCPIALGAALCDCARLPDADMRAAPIGIGPVSQPLLLVPFLAEVARLRGAALRLGWPQGAVTIGPDGGVGGDLAALAAAERLEASLAAAPDAPAAPAAPAPEAGPPFVPHAILADLDAYALRTTVPASDASRAGAGGGESD
ncbi:hypothetical protein LNKW23_06790 [Paralimibaculum aggregatum]|uniref:DUF3726 domain-containing protein n=1 Tax=Paralimibaculum aggregatum TaxID=3036245 RepID=A0ABQ6LDP0_9RHOB|nr:DUF3726 domain-containing protein [Limibaculum sp. NKW23]GMG81466.1 hypothetical protein LNKW23_06790 [Limibaculum sp. NKW23]